MKDIIKQRKKLSVEKGEERRVQLLWTLSNVRALHDEDNVDIIVENCLTRQASMTLSSNGSRKWSSCQTSMLYHPERLYPIVLNSGSWKWTSRSVGHRLMMFYRNDVQVETITGRICFMVKKIKHKHCGRWGIKSATELTIFKDHTNNILPESF